MTTPTDLKNFIDQDSVVLNGTGTVDQMGSSDVYRLNFDNSGIFVADLTKLTGDADVRLIQDLGTIPDGRIDAAAGEVVAWQWERGTKDESIRHFVNPGEYFLQVFSVNNETVDYQLKTNFEQSDTDNRKFTVDIQFDKDEFRDKVGLTEAKIAKLDAAINNAEELWESVVPYSSKNKPETLKISLELEDFGADSSAIANANGRTIKFNINPEYLKSGNNFFESPSDFEVVTAHEIGHILGVKAWKKNVDENKGIYKSNTQAGWAFGELLGSSQPVGVPITTNNGKGSDYRHWKKRVFDNELMTEDFPQDALSSLTVAALDDIGWEVNYGAAQAYAPSIRQASFNLLIEEIQALDEDGIGGNPNFYAKVEVDGEKYSQTANEQAESNFSPVYPNWSSSKNIFYNPNSADNWIPVTIRLFDKDKGLFDGTRKDDHVDINENPDERNLNLEYDLITGALRNRDDKQITYAPDANGRFFSEGDNSTELVWGDFDRDGETDVQRGPSDKVGIRFSIQTILALASILPNKFLQLNPNSSIHNSFLLKHVGGIAGNEVIEIAAHGLTQQFGPGTAEDEFVRIKISDGDSSSSYVLDEIVTPASISGGAGDDEIYSGKGNDYISGGTGSDYISGGAGDDWIVGDGGSDTMHGGLGNDVFTVHNTLDKVIEFSDEGTDTVYTHVNYTLSDHVENMTLRDAVYQGRGNSSNNTIRGNGSQNLIEGLDGSDNLHGYYGDDVLNGGKGDDYLNGGYDHDELIGGIGNDKLAGNNGDDVLTGGAGDDLLLGGVGADTFIFEKPTDGLDQITDFSQMQNDALNILGSGFGGNLSKGLLDSRQFVLGSTSANADSRFLYHQSTGSLSFDSDGTGNAAATKIATLSNKADLSYSDILIV